MATLDTLITRVQELLSLAGGLNVQTYAQPKIIQFIQMGYTTLVDTRFWNDYTTNEVYTLDGSTGKVTTDLTDVIKYFRDIEYIWIVGYDNPLPQAPKNRPLGNIRFNSFAPSGDPVCPFVVLPTTYVGSVEVRFRTRSTLPFVETDEVHMDEELLVRWAAMTYLTFDNANPAAMKIVSDMYAARLDQLNKEETSNSKSLYSSTNQVVTEWHDA